MHPETAAKIQGELAEVLSDRELALLTLASGKVFGCGASRQHEAVETLLGRGVQVAEFSDMDRLLREHLNAQVQQARGD